MLQHSVSAFLCHRHIHHVFVVVSPDDAHVNNVLRPDPRLTVLTCGGATRAQSVLNGLTAIESACDSLDWVLVHDAARPGINGVLISRLIEQVGDHEAGGLLAISVVDTVKLKTFVGGVGKLATLPRAGMWLAQTPQMFRYEKLNHALKNAQKNNIDMTDEASAIEASGWTPVLVEGHWCNTKITRPDDLALVEAAFATSDKDKND